MKIFHGLKIIHEFVYEALQVTPILLQVFSHNQAHVCLCELEQGPSFANKSTINIEDNSQRQILTFKQIVEW